MAGLQVGDRVPESVLLQTHEEQQRPLADWLGERALVLYFYPKDDTPICTREACHFRDAYHDFLDAGATVVGVSSDDAEAHRRFRQRHDLPFTLAADTDGALRAAFGVPKTLGLLAGRVTYVIDRHGVIRHVFNARFAADRHVEEALRVVRVLAAEA